MWSLKITTEQRYKYFEPILPDIRTNIQLFWKLQAHGELYTWNLYPMLVQIFLNATLKSFIIERTLDNQYQITFYE